VDTLSIFGMLDNVGALLGNLRLLVYVEMKCVSYDWLVLEFLSFMHVDRVGPDRGKEC